ncbi:MAG: adenine deaminase [Thermotogae bacterium]|nr:adenine deaminase [Thermotogota bacterium]
MKIKDIIPVALGKEVPDILLTNLKLLNIFSGKTEETSIALHKKRIAGIGNYSEGKEIIDLKGQYVLPGFIDAHLHIESSMLSPRRFAELVLPSGTTTVIADPHEIANVIGIDGLDYMIKSTEGIPLNVYIAVPSAVPSTNLETSGARLGPEDIIGFIDNHPRRVISLGEVMNFPGVLNLDPELLTKIEILRHKYKKIDGHAPFVTGKELNAYINAFIKSDHECTTVEEALEKVSRGMQIFIREGTAAKNFNELIKAVNINNHQFFSFCTDDKDPKDILSEGHINYMVKKSVEYGLDPLVAVRMATINTAKYFNLRSMGAVAPGYKADMVVVDNLKDFNINTVIKDSKIVVENGKLLSEVKGFYNEMPSKIGNVILPDFSEKTLEIKVKGKKIRVITLEEGSIITKEKIEYPKISGGIAVSAPERDIIKVAVIERHKGSHFSLGFAQGLGIKSGAIGTSIGHDSHNLGIAGTNDKDMIIAAKKLQEMNGGLVIVKNEKILWYLELPIGGLMSDRKPEYVVEILSQQKDALNAIGCKKDIFMTLAFIQLPVIPEIKITDLGIIDVAKQKIVDLFTE